MSVTFGRSEVFSGYSGFLHQWNWLPRHNWNIVESGIKHHNPNTNIQYTLLLTDQIFLMPNEYFFFNFNYIMVLTWYIWWVDDVCFVLYKHAYLDFYYACSLKQLSASRHVTPLVQIILIPSLPVFALTRICYVLSIEAANSNLVWPDWTQTHDLPLTITSQHGSLLNSMTTFMNLMIMLLSDII